MTPKNTKTSLRARSRAQKSLIEGRIVELDPAHVHAAGLIDRLRNDGGSLEDLVASIKENGQEVPVIVRPDPSRPGDYLIVAGRRRLQACRLLENHVKAEIRDLDDEAAMIVQVTENLFRNDLTYFEKARTATFLVDEGGLPPERIDTTFGCGPTDRSRYLKVGRGIPEDIANWVGDAKTVGRTRWEPLVNAIAADPALVDRMREALATANPEMKKMKSATRFKLLHEIAVGASPEVETDIVADGHDEPIGRVRSGPKSTRFVFDAAACPDFVAWLAAEPSRVAALLLEAFERESRANAPSQGGEQ